MLAHGIRSYHRPTRLEDALTLAAQGVVPLGGGTRLLASDIELPNVLDLSGLGLTGIEIEDGDLVLGAMVTLQDVIESRVAYAATAGLLPAACRAQSASRMVRGMATVGGEAVHGAPDSEVVAALLALNAVFVVRHAAEPRRDPGPPLPEGRPRRTSRAAASCSRSSCRGRRRGRPWSGWPSCPPPPRSCPWP